MSSLPGTTSLLSPIAPRWSHGWSTGLSVVLILLGLVAVILPQIGGLAVALYFGWLLLLGGVTLLVFAWRTHAAGVMSLQVALGVVYVLLGLFLIVRPGLGWRR